MFIFTPIQSINRSIKQLKVLLLVSVVRATMESGRLEAPFPEVYRRWLAALQKLVSAGRQA